MKATEGYAPSKGSESAILAWERATTAVVLYAKTLADPYRHMDAGVEASQQAGFELDEAMAAAQSIIKSGYIEQEMDRLTNYDSLSDFTAVRFFGLASACADFVDWIKGGPGSGRVVGPYLKVGDLHLALKHMDWGANVLIKDRYVDQFNHNQWAQKVIEIHQPTAELPVYLLTTL